MRLTLVGARLIDGTAADPVARTTVTVEDARIVAIGEDPRRGDEIIDLAGWTLLPGLINAHCHIAAVGLIDEDRVPAAVVAAWTFEHCRRMIDLGITTARDMGGVDGGVVAALNAGLVEGPRLLVCGPLLVQTGGHVEFRPPYVRDPLAHNEGVPGLSVMTHPVDGPDQMRHAARLAFKRGASFLKLCASGGVTSLSDSLEDTQFSVEEMRVAVEEARARRTYVAAHTHNNEGIRRGLEAGIACFEHVTAIDADVAERVARAGAAIVPTLTVAHVYREYAGQLPATVIERIAGVEKGMANAVRVGHEAGILVGAGADLIGRDQSQYGFEFPLHAGVVGAKRALETVTRDNARVLRIDRELGTVEKGKVADLVAVEGDPLADPWLMSKAENVTLVIKEGRVMKNVLDLPSADRRYPPTGAR